VEQLEDFGAADVVEAAVESGERVLHGLVEQEFPRATDGDSWCTSWSVGSLMGLERSVNDNNNKQFCE